MFNLNLDNLLVPLITIVIYETLKYLGSLILPESIKLFFAKKLELFKGSIGNRIPYKEIIRQSLSSSIDKYNDIRLKYYTESYLLFFEVLLIDSNIKKHNISKDKSEELYNDLFDKLQKLREGVFINKIYSPEFFNYLLSFQIGLHDDLRLKYHKHLYQKVDENNYIEKYNPSDEIDKAGKWLINNSLTNITLKDVINYHFEETKEFSANEKGSIQGEKK
ncbi:hypothetical protein EHO58_01505 [Leptospira selangorensis]|uniref:hypothetical protein n=1 Tax=Leptospira selangorensis TaxID=2484982 RepID=UPI001083306F|nr:hypothetical protein [Leptospira selangorensis]TGK10127.1 hypothetical protein EHO58_01505 [Leptospira selangorensis]